MIWKRKSRPDLSGIVLNGICRDDQDWMGGTELTKRDCASRNATFRGGLNGSCWELSDSP